MDMHNSGDHAARALARQPGQGLWREVLRDNEWLVRHLKKEEESSVCRLWGLGCQ